MVRYTFDWKDSGHTECVVAIGRLLIDVQTASHLCAGHRSFCCLVELYDVERVADARFYLRLRAHYRRLALCKLQPFGLRVAVRGLVVSRVLRRGRAIDNSSSCIRGQRTPSSHRKLVALLPLALTHQLLELLLLELLHIAIR